VTLRVAAGIWFLFSLVMVVGFLNEWGGEGQISLLLIVGVLALVTAWLGYRTWRGPSWTIAVIGACVAAFYVVFLVAAVLQGSLSMPQGLAAPILAALAGVLPLVSKRRRSQ
jgi:hypothetical protein